MQRIAFGIYDAVYYCCLLLLSITVVYYGCLLLLPITAVYCCFSLRFSFFSAIIMKAMEN